ncbi:JmjC domain-containing histone demethylation protein 3D, partial [Colletotrichum sojae]
MTSKTDPLERLANKLREMLDTVEAVREKVRLERSTGLPSARALRSEATALQAPSSGDQLRQPSLDRSFGTLQSELNDLIQQCANVQFSELEYEPAIANNSQPSTSPNPNTDNGSQEPRHKSSNTSGTETPRGESPLQGSGASDLSTAKQFPATNKTVSLSNRADVREDTSNKLTELFKLHDAAQPPVQKPNADIRDLRNVFSISTQDEAAKGYVFGDFPAFSGIESPLPDIGSSLRGTSLTEDAGVATPDAYHSEDRLSGTGMHMKYLNHPSVNMLLWGEGKVWLIVKPTSTKAFEEDGVLKHWVAPGQNISTFSEFVGSLNRIVSRKTLDSWGVEYDIVRCNPGQLIVTMPDTYHQFVNLGPNLAEAANVDADFLQHMPPEYQFCSDTRHCPKGSTRPTHVRFKVDLSNTPKDKEIVRGPESRPQERRRVEGDAEGVDGGEDEIDKLERDIGADGAKHCLEILRAWRETSSDPQGSLFLLAQSDQTSRAYIGEPGVPTHRRGHVLDL